MIIKPTIVALGAERSHIFIFNVLFRDLNEYQMLDERMALRITLLCIYMQLHIFLRITTDVIIMNS